MYKRCFLFFKTGSGSGTGFPCHLNILIKGLKILTVFNHLMILRNWSMTYFRNTTKIDWISKAWPCFVCNSDPNYQMKRVEHWKYACGHAFSYRTNSRYQNTNTNSVVMYYLSFLTVPIFFGGDSLVGIGNGVLYWWNTTEAQKPISHAKTKQLNSAMSGPTLNWLL